MYYLYTKDNHSHNVQLIQKGKYISITIMKELNC